MNGIGVENTWTEGGMVLMWMGSRGMDASTRPWRKQHHRWQAHLPRLKTEPSTIVQRLQKQALKRLKKHRTKARHQGSLNESNPAGTRGKE